MRAGAWMLGLIGAASVAGLALAQPASPPLITPYRRPRLSHPRRTKRRRRPRARPRRW
jgi:hypothetical protein